MKCLCKSLWSFGKLLYQSLLHRKKMFIQRYIAERIMWYLRDIAFHPEKFATCFKILQTVEEYTTSIKSSQQKRDFESFAIETKQHHDTLDVLFQFVILRVLTSSIEAFWMHWIVRQWIDADWKSWTKIFFNF